MLKKTFSLFLLISLLFPLPIHSQESQNNLSVTATIPAQPDDFTTTTALIDPSPASSYPQSTVLTYQVTYGSTLSNPVNITLEANWSLGTIAGSGSPSVEIADYVVNSASNAYGGAVPVIDTVNRKITWTITSFPANTTNQTVTFQLETNSNYTGGSTVDFDISSLIHGPGVDSATSTITTTYLYSSSPTPTPTPTSAPGPTSTPANPTSTPTPTPTNTGSTFLFDNIYISSKTANTATIAVTTNQVAREVVFYGKSINSLTKSTNSKGINTINFIELTNLEPNTKYYYKVQAINSNGIVINSDIFTFTTAIESNLPSINLETLIATSQDKVILDGALAKSIGSSTIIAPLGLNIEVRFAVNKDAQLKRIVLNTRPKNVLGANTFSNIEPPETGSTLIEIQKGIYYGRLKVGKIGLFELIARIEDENGNIVEQKVAEIRVIELMRVVNKNNKLPIEGARISLFFFNLQSNRFEFISPSSLAIKNPSYSTEEGTVNLVLPPGEYRVKAEALGYKTQIVEFEIGTGDKEIYPLITLDRGPITLSGILNFIINTVNDLFGSGKEIFDSFSISSRLALLLHGLTILLFICLLIFCIALYFSVAPFMLPNYIFYHLTQSWQKHTNSQILRGVVINKQDGYGVKSIFVYIRAGKRVIAHTITNSFGEFYVKVPKANIYQITTVHSSFKPSAVNISKPEEFEKNHKIYVEEKRNNLFSKIFYQAGWYGGYLLSDVTELALVAVLALEVAFMLNFGVITTLPFIITAILNLILLLYFRKHKEEAKLHVD